MRRVATILLVLVATCFSQGVAQTVDSVRTEAVRSRGFIRGAETQLTKVIGLLDSLEVTAGVDTVEVQLPPDTVEVCPDGWTCTPPDTVPEDTATTPDPEPTGDYPDGITDEQGAQLQRILGVPALEPVPDAVYNEVYNYWSDVQESRDAINHGYDPELGVIAAYWRTNDESELTQIPYYLQRYRDEYVIPNNGAIPPRNLRTEGLAAHYVMTGEQASRDAVVMIADATAHWIDKHVEHSTRYIDGRTWGRPMIAQLMAHELTGEQQYADKATEGVEAAIAWFDAAGANGFWDSEAIGGESYCGGMASFQILHAILPGLARYDELIAPVDRLPEILNATLDRLWNYWDPAIGFSYAIPPQSYTGALLDWDCTTGAGNASAKPSKHLDLLTVIGYAYGYAHTGQQRHKDRAEEIWNLGLSGSNPPTQMKIDYNNSKVYFQNFAWSWRTPHLLGW